MSKSEKDIGALTVIQISNFAMLSDRQPNIQCENIPIISMGLSNASISVVYSPKRVAIASPSMFT